MKRFWDNCTTDQTNWKGQLEDQEEQSDEITVNQVLLMTVVTIKCDAGSNTNDEKAGRRYNSERNVCRWKNNFSTKLTISCN